MAVPTSENEDFRRWTIGAILLSIALRMIWNGVASPPALPEEARYWVDGQRFSWGYSYAQPLSAWLVRLSTDLFGTGLFGLRLFAPLCHGIAAWFIFVTARRMFGYDEEGPRVGFWSALTWLTMPGVVVSTGFMTSEPALMAAWAMAIYALVRAMQEGDWLWWAACGGAAGIGFLAAPVMVAFPLGALGYAVFSREEEDKTVSGPLIATVIALVIAAPTLFWIAEEGTVEGWGPIDLGLRNLGTFAAAQFGIFGPIMLAALVVLCISRREWREWQMRLLLWLSLPLIGFMALRALTTGASFQAAAPSYIAGSIAVCAFFVRHNFSKLLQVSVAVGLGIWAGYWSIASLYDTRHAALPRGPDPFKKLRSFKPICEASLASARASEGGAILADNRRLLAVCMFEGSIGPDQAALWDPSNAGAKGAPLLRESDSRRFVYVTLNDDASAVTERFREAEQIGQVPFRSHRDRTYVASVWELQGFLGYNN